MEDEAQPSFSPSFPSKLAAFPVPELDGLVTIRYISINILQMDFGLDTPLELDAYLYSYIESFAALTVLAKTSCSIARKRMCHPDPFEDMENKGCS